MRTWILLGGLLAVAVLTACGATAPSQARCYAAEMAFARKLHANPFAVPSLGPAQAACKGLSAGQLAQVRQLVLTQYAAGDLS